MKRQNIWDEDAWKNISKRDADLSDIQDIFRQQKKRDFTAESFHNEQMRAEFADFNVDGLRKFQQSQKHQYHNPLLHDKREMDFSQPVQKKDLASDFLNWDMNPEPQLQPQVVTDEFSNFDFGSAQKHPSTAADDFFNLGVPQPQVSTTAAPQTANFWDAFGTPEQQPAPVPVSQQQTPEDAPAEKVQRQPSTQDLLLQLSLDPNDPVEEAHKPSTPQQPAMEAPAQPAPTGPASFLDIELS